MNPKTNKFEPLSIKNKKTRKAIEEVLKKTNSLSHHPEHFSKVDITKLVRPNGEPVPEHWSTFTENEKVVVKNYTFKVVYIGETYMVLEPVGPVLVNEKK